VPEWLWDIVIVAAALAAAAIASLLVAWALRRLERRIEGVSPDEPTIKRAKTITGLARVTAVITIWVIAILTALAEIGVQIGPLLAAAGVGGIVIGLGAQSFVKDLIAGFFVIAERQYDVGDVVQVADVTGTVEEIGIRTTVLRDLDASRHVVPNGEIRVSTNMTRDFSRYLLDLPIPYDADPDAVMQIVRETAEQMRIEPHWKDDVVAPVDVLGVEDYAESAVTVRVLLQCRPGRQWAVGREYRRRLKAALEAVRISIPFPHRELIVRHGAGAPEGDERGS
jgi:small conductance mechanosensitive channel